MNMICEICFNYQPRLRRQKYIQIHTKNKSRKEYLRREVYPFEKYKLPKNPHELEYRIYNSREQTIKALIVLFRIVVKIEMQCKG